MPVDERARAAAVAAGADETGAWLAAVSGGVGRVEARVVSTADVEVLRTTLLPQPDGSPMTVGEVALAVDTGRELAARAAAEGAHVVVATDGGAATSDAAAAAVSGALANPEPGGPGPLGILRRRGDPTIAVLCGIALGAGEQGLGCVCEGQAAVAGAAVAAAIEPDLGPRVREGPVEATLAALG